MKASICFVGMLISTIFAVPTKDRNDDILALQPPFVRNACQETCPDTCYRILRIVEHQKDKPSTYTVTFFNTGPGTAWRKAGDDWIAELPQYNLELGADGRVLEEQAHDISAAALPKAVSDGFRKWNPSGAKGMWVRWGVAKAKNEKRTFMVMIVFNQVDATHAAFLEDGSLITEKSFPSSTVPDKNQ
jgi:hypothetical protein